MLLPIESLEQQFIAFNILSLDPTENTTAKLLESHLESPTILSTSQLVQIRTLVFEYTLELDSYKIDCVISLSLLLHTPLYSISLQQPIWLSRDGHSKLQQRLAAESTSDLIETLDQLRDYAIPLIPVTAVDLVISLEKEEEEEIRIWYWFPSLSTKAKRDDLITYARAVGLTGFVLAGKPGMLCVEGKLKSIDAYLGQIKSVSWSDIPSFQKKVTERHREPILTRAFQSMQEITSEITQHGQRGNRGEMSQVKEFMRVNGVESAFSIVVGL